MTDLQEKAMRLALKFCEDIGDFQGPYPYVDQTTIVGDSRKILQVLRQALAQPEQEPVSCVYKATNHYGETAHFGVRSAAEAWAKNGTVKAVPIKNLKLVQKPCLSCESLARTVMLDQTYHENIIEQQKQKSVVYQCPRCAVSMEIDTMAKPSLPKREWVGLTDEEMRELEKQFNAERVRTSDEEYLVIYPADYWQWQRAIEAKLKEKNT